MYPPKVQYARSQDVHIAYQLIGEGPIDIVLAPGAYSHLGVYWESSDLVSFFHGLTRFARLLLFDKRGSGMSDRAVGLPTLEERIDDIRAVMDAADSAKAVIFGFSQGAQMSALFGAMYPERTVGLVIFGGEPKGAWAPDYPWGGRPEDYEAARRRIDTDWTGRVESFGGRWAPSHQSDPQFLEWASKLIRYSVTPASMIRYLKIDQEVDLRAVLPTIHVPTLVIHPVKDQITPVEAGRYMAQQIPGARYLEYPGADHAFWPDPVFRSFVLTEVQKFVEGLRETKDPNRVLTTVLFVDIVGSTATASSIGDERWGRTLGQFYATARETLATYRGQEIKRLGDGILATFDGPSRAVGCALELQDRLQGLRLTLRAGVHTGECVLREGDIEGIAVHLASRLVKGAKPGEVLVSGTVRDLAAGSNLRFLGRGSRPIRGVPGRWRVFSAARPATDADPA